MGRVLQKRKRVSSIPKKRQKPKSKKQILHNPIIAANWDPKQTATQNYRRLGLVSKLNKSTGGKEKTIGLLEEDEGLGQGLQDDSLAINPAKKAAKITTEEVVIERDPATGAIIKVIEKEKDNPLNDPLNDLDDDSGWNFTSMGKVGSSHGKERETTVTRELEEFAASGEKPRSRPQSEREQQWIAALVEKHGDDYRAMFWDKKLNVYQQSEGDLKRRVKKWRKLG